MRCLCCGKEIKETACAAEIQNCWHKKCIKNFFGTDKMPDVDISPKQLEQLANDAVNKGLTVPGVQKKLSLHLSQEGEIRLTIVDYPTGYILKPQTEEFESLPEFEHLSMRLAQLAGIKTVPNALIKSGDSYMYITRRVDRQIGNGSNMLLAMEDFCQLAGRMTRDKYKGSYEACAKIIRQYSVRKGFDMTELFVRVLFSFITGNSDMHLKNFSLREGNPKDRNFALSEAYDMLPVNIVMPEDDEELALTLNGRKKKIKKADFVAFAQHCEITESAACKIISKMCSLKQKFMEECEQSQLSDENKEKIKVLIKERIKRLTDR